MQENPQSALQAGELAQVAYKSGEYVAEIVEVNPPRALIKVLAVLKHPEQGDLHNLYDPDAPMFHERRALAYTEKANVLVRDLKAYRGDVPDYTASLRRAVDESLRGLDRLKRWSEQALAQLQRVKQDYKLPE